MSAVPTSNARLVLQQPPSERLGDVLQHGEAIGLGSFEQLLSGIVVVLGDLVWTLSICS